MDHAANASRGRRRDHVLRAADVRAQMVGAAPVADGQQGCVRDDDVGAGKAFGQSIRLSEIRTPELDDVASERTMWRPRKPVAPVSAIVGATSTCSRASCRWG